MGAGMNYYKIIEICKWIIIGGGILFILNIIMFLWGYDLLDKIRGIR
jgi:hypothetical protein